MKPLAGPILTAAQMRDAEEFAMARGPSEADLMETAGAAIAEAVWRLGGGRETLILCGPGNNGGDGYVAARLLAARGVQVRVAALRDPKKPAAIAAAKFWTGPVEAFETAMPSPILVDALFGTGLARPLEANVTERLDSLKVGAEFIIAVDLPSGVATDIGDTLGGIVADYTLALGALKPAHLLHPAARLCGQVAVADIGVPVNSTAQVLIKPHLALPGPDAHKYRRGMAAIVGGQMPGAALLSASAATRTAGYVVLCDGAAGGPDAIVRRDWIDVAADARVGAVLVGPGLGRGDAAREMLARVLGSVHPLVLDADALALLDAEDVAALAQRDAPTILTPHAGEFASLFPRARNKIDATRDAAARSRTTIVHKGADTVVATHDGRVAVSPTATGWLASAGTGDVLAGLIAGLLSGGMAPFDAAQAGVWLHAEAARLAGPALIADDLIDHLPAAIAVAL
jgi:ADP-dependent NAD(P)H-hydrate dehydratase / NAD(P)H-hydrate epimerase